MAHEPTPLLDCGDNSCHFAKPGGLRTNGSCSCLEGLDGDPGKRQHTIAAIRALVAERDAFKMQLLATLGLLASSSYRFRPGGESDEMRDMIGEALTDAQKLIPNLRWRRVRAAFSVEESPI